MFSISSFQSREEKLKQQVAQLQKIINELQKEITGKDKHIQDLHNQIAEQVWIIVS